MIRKKKTRRRELEQKTRASDKGEGINYDTRLSDMKQMSLKDECTSNVYCTHRNSHAILDSRLEKTKQTKQGGGS